MADLSEQRLIAVSIVLVVASLVVPVVASSQTDFPDDVTRIFYADDPDRDPNSSVSGRPARESIDLATYATIGDVAYDSTRPSITADGTTLWAYRRRQVAAIDRTSETAIRFPHSPGGKQSSERQPLLSEAHVTFMGINGGARPHLTAGSGGRYPLFIGRSGEVLNVLDYRYRPENVPDEYTDDCTTTYDTETREIDNETRVVYRDGTRICTEYRTSIDESRQLQLDGETIASGTNRVLSYNGLSRGGVATLSVVGRLTATIVEDGERYDWDPLTDPVFSPSNGTWERTDTWQSVVATESVTVRDSRDVVVTDAGSISFHQTVIEQGEQNYVVLALEGPSSGDRMTRSDLRTRVLLSSIDFADGQTIDTTWSTYTTRRYEHGYRIDESGAKTPIDVPHVLQMRLFGMTRRPTVGAGGSTDTGGTTARVRGFEGVDVAPQTRSFPSQVNFPRRQPRVFTRLAVSNAPSPVETVTTIHGQTVDVDVDRRIPYRRPTVTIEAHGDDQVRIHVTDPETGDGLSGRRLLIEGASKREAVTGPSGEVLLDRTGTYVGVTVERDSLANPGPVFYDRTRASATFVPTTALLEHLHRLIERAVLASPLVGLLLWLRRRDRFV